MVELTLLDTSRCRSVSAPMPLVNSGAWTLDEILDAYMGSSAGDWHGIAAPLVPETNAHELLYIYRPNAAIVVADGHGEDDLHTWDWVNVFPDHTARNLIPHFLR